MTQIAQDTFVRANENPLSNGGKWTALSGVFAIIANKLTNQALGQNTSWWNANPFANDQYADITVGAMENIASFDQGPLIRLQTGGGLNFYVGAVLSTATGLVGATVFISKVVAAAETGLAVAIPSLTTINSGDIIRLRVRGQKLYLLQNGVPLLIAVDSTFPSGVTAVHNFDSTNTGQNLIGPWTAGNLDAIVLGNVTDSFVRANNTILGTNWIQVACANQTGFIGISGNMATSNATGSTQVAAYAGNAVEFLANQFAQSIVRTISGANAVGPATRISGAGFPTGLAQTSSGSCYVLWETATTLFLEKLTLNPSGITFGVLAQTPVVGTVGDVLRLESRGITHTAFRNGVQALQVVDSSLPDGNPGISSFGATMQQDTFSAGSFPSSSFIQGFWE